MPDIKLFENDMKREDFEATFAANCFNANGGAVEVKPLQRQRTKPKKFYSTISNEIRLCIINSLDSGKMSMRQAASAFNVAYTSVSRIYREFNLTNKVESKRRGGNRMKILNEDDNQYIKDLLADDCTISLGKIQRKLKHHLNKSVSLATLQRTLHYFNYAFKRLDLTPKTTMEPGLELRRRDYCNLIVQAQNDKKNIVYFTEAVFKISMRRGYGVKPTPADPRLRIRNVTIMAAMSMSGLLHYEALIWPDHTDSIHNYLDRLFDIITIKGMQDVVIVADFDPLHNLQEIRAKFEGRGHGLVLLPPHNIVFNPVENLFNHLKNTVENKKPENESQLMACVKGFQSYCKPGQCANYFGYVSNNIDNFLNGLLKFDH